MSFHSFDALNEPGWNPLSSDISEERRQKNGSDLKKALSLIALLQELPRGYRPLLDEFQLFNFNPLTQQVTQKELKELHHVISEMCVIFDKPSNRIFYCSEKLDALELEVIQAYLKELIGQNLEWNTVDEGTWEDLCDEFSQHTLLLELQDNGTVTLSQSSSVELDNEAEASEKSDDQKNSPNQLTHDELTQLLAIVNARLLRLQQELLALKRKAAETAKKKKTAPPPHKDVPREQILINISQSELIDKEREYKEASKEKERVQERKREFIEYKERLTEEIHTELNRKEILEQELSRRLAKEHPDNA